MLLQALLDTGHGIRRHVHSSIFAPFPLHDMQGLLLPIDLLQLEVGHLRDPQSTAEDHEKQRAVHRMGDLGKQPLHLLAGEGFGQGAPAPDKVTGLHRITSYELLVETKVKKMLECIESAVDRRPGTPLVMLVLHKLVHLVKGDLGERDRDLGKEQAEIEGITRDRVRRELPALQVRLKPVYSGLADVIPRLPPLEPLVFFDLGHRLVVLRPFGPVIELGIAQRDIEGAVSHQLFDHLQRCSGIEELGRKGMPQ
jgi:hypothetical protein